MKAGVTQPVTEWIERLAGKIPVTRGELGGVIRIMRQVMIVVDRLLTCGLRPTHRQLAARVHIAEEDIDNGIATHRAREPCLQDRRHMRRGPADIERPAAQQNENDWLSRSLNRLQHLLLISREAERRS